MEAALKALAEPRRRQILELVRDGEHAAREIAEHFEVTRTAISQHLTVLREAGLVTERRDGRRRLYRARPEGLMELREFLDGFWRAGLQRLKTDAERSARDRRAGPQAGATPGAGAGNPAGQRGEHAAGHDPPVTGSDP